VARPEPARQDPDPAARRGSGGIASKRASGRSSACTCGADRRSEGDGVDDLGLSDWLRGRHCSVFVVQLDVCARTALGAPRTVRDAWRIEPPESTGRGGGNGSTSPAHLPCEMEAADRPGELTGRVRDSGSTSRAHRPCARQPIDLASPLAVCEAADRPRVAHRARGRNGSTSRAQAAREATDRTRVPTGRVRRRWIWTLGDHRPA
jgi:hypothetical protein